MGCQFIYILSKISNWYIYILYFLYCWYYILCFYFYMYHVYYYYIYIYYNIIYSQYYKYIYIHICFCIIYKYVIFFCISYIWNIILSFILCYFLLYHVIYIDNLHELSCSGWYACTRFIWYVPIKQRPEYLISGPSGVATSALSEIGETLGNLQIHSFFLKTIQ